MYSQSLNNILTLTSHLSTSIIFLNQSKGKTIISPRREPLVQSTIISGSRANLTLVPLSKTKSLSTLDFLLKANIRFQDISTIRTSQFHPNSCVNLTTNIQLLPATLNLAVAQVLTTS
ncbi:Hypothetical_protein [Hexamita inflata]|uniref:Hypothetical_protein n=1 Tax=Hexamita inflata TaxID=28002 RepID=A0AA86UM65_9EUKA|nr:Hypothetical protein HINF_LOCUS48524 [Hexamita inflata]